MVARGSTRAGRGSGTTALIVVLVLAAAMVASRSLGRQEGDRSCRPSSGEVYTIDLELDWLIDHIPDARIGDIKLDWRIGEAHGTVLKPSSIFYDSNRRVWSLAAQLANCESLPYDGVTYAHIRVEAPGYIIARIRVDGRVKDFGTGTHSLCVYPKPG